jgi:hypothetical protein
MNRSLIIILLAIVGCSRPPDDLREHLDGWEISTTYRILPSRTIRIEDKIARTFSGTNNVLIVESIHQPIFKPDHVVTDLTSFRDLFIELSDSDTLVTPQSAGNSKMIRQITAFSPDFGAKQLRQNEKIEIKKINKGRWRVTADLEDFQFEGEFSFADSTTVTNRYRKMYEVDL